MKTLLLASLIALPLFASAGEETPAMLESITGTNLELIDANDAAGIRGETITIPTIRRSCWRGHCWTVLGTKKVTVPVPYRWGIRWVKH